MAALCPENLPGYDCDPRKCEVLRSGRIVYTVLIGLRLSRRSEHTRGASGAGGHRFESGRPGELRHRTEGLPVWPWNRRFSATDDLAHGLRIPLRELDEVDALDINLDGAHEIDPQYRMIKGRGGALLRGKIVACASNQRVTMVAVDKRVARRAGRTEDRVQLVLPEDERNLKHIERLYEKHSQLLRPVYSIELNDAALG